MPFLSYIEKCIDFIDIALKWIKWNNNQNSPSKRISSKNSDFLEWSLSSNYIWNGTVFELIELAVALQKTELIRKKSGELLTYAEIVKGMKRLFNNVKVSNIYSCRTRTMERKKNASPLLERMLVLYKQEVEKLYR